MVSSALMRARALLVLSVFLAFSSAAAELSGSFSTAFTFGTSFAAWNTLDLRLSFSDFQIRSLSTWQGLSLSEQAFSLSGNLGDLEIQVGLVLKPVSSLRLGAWSAQEFQVVASFVSFELSLGNFQLRLTLHTGPGEP